MRPDVPRTALEIDNRINEISSNASLIGEVRTITFVTWLIDLGRIPEGSMKRMLVRSIAADDVMQMLSTVSKMNTIWEFLPRLRDIGRERAAQWPGNALDRVGEALSADVRSVLQRPLL